MSGSPEGWAFKSRRGREAAQVALRSLFQHRASLVVVQSVIIPTAALFIGLYFSREATNDVWLATAIVILMLLSLVVALGLFYTDRSGSRVLSDIFELEEKLEREQDLRNKYQHQLSIASNQAGLVRTFRDIISSPFDFDDAVIRRRALRLLLEALRDTDDVLFGVARGERWNYAIYIFDAGEGVLNCVAWSRGWETRGGEPPRSWPVGVGVAGTSFANDREVIVEDANDPIITQAISPHRDYTNHDDDVIYRSLAAVPISRVDGQPLGVVVATSDAPGRFAQRDGYELEPLRDLAAAVDYIFLNGFRSGRKSD